MKLNLENYKEDTYYDNTLTKEEEEKILEYINNYKREEYDNILKKDKSVYVNLQLSSIRNNIINWYGIEPESNILEICANFGAITGAFCNKAKKVVSIESVKSHAEAIFKRYENISNLEIICANLKDIKLEEKFDYVTLIGVLEFAEDIVNNSNINKEDAVNIILEFAKNNLKENGKILIATDNKFGIKYFAGAKYSKKYNAFENIMGNISKDSPKTFSKIEIENILKNLNLNDYKFYYPLPDYKLINVIFSDEYIPNEHSSKIKYNVYYNDFEDIIINEHMALKEIIKNNQFSFFANSYFIEIGKNTKQEKFIGFNNMRKDKYRLITKIYDKEVEKVEENPKSKHQIEKITRNIYTLNKLGFNTIDKNENNKISSKFINGQTLDNIINTYMMENKTSIAIEQIKTWYNYISSKLLDDNYKEANNIFDEFNIEIEEKIKGQMNFIEHGFIDLVFENIFYVENNYIVYDQEWYERNVPVEFILYRAINNLYYHNPKIQQKVDINNMYEIMKIEKFVDVFKVLEQKWQEKLTNKNIVNFYSNTYESIKTLEELKYDNKTGKKEIEILKTEIKRLEEINSKKTEENEELNKKINIILNSKSWKYTKIFRNKKNKLI